MRLPEVSKLAARVLLGVIATACIVGMVGPFQGLERALVPWDKAAHFMAFYGMTLLLFAGFPDRRRYELAMLAVLVGFGVEIAQQLSGRDAGMGDIAANSLGALAVLAPVYLDRLRGVVRNAPDGEPVERRRGALAALAEWRPAQGDSGLPAGEVPALQRAVNRLP